MKQITLIPSDFENLNIPVDLSGGNSFIPFDGQYSDATDCPINRALKRLGVAVERVHEEKYYPDNVSIKGYPHEVERCRLELLAGAKEAYIEVL